MSPAAEMAPRPSWAAFVPALFLLLSVIPGGMRSPAAWAVFSAALLAYLAFFDGRWIFSGAGMWGWLAAWLLAGLAFSPEPLNSFWWFSRYLSLLAFFCLAYRAGGAARSAWLGAVFLIAAASSFTVIWQALAGQGISRMCEVRGMIGPNVNYSTAFMAAAFSGLAAQLPGPARRPVKLACLAAMALLGFTIVAAKSRGALLGVLAASGALALLRWRLRAAVYGLAAALLFIALLPAEYFNWLMKAQDPRSLGRLSIWGAALDAAAASPVFGQGLGLFERAFEAFKHPFHDGISFFGHSTLHAHSEPLNLAAEAGLPAAALFVLAWARGTFRPAAGDGRTLALKMLSVSLFAQSAVDIIFYAGSSQVLFFGTLGLLAGGEARAEERRPVRRRAVLGLLLACWGAAFALRLAFARARACALDGAAPEPARADCLRTAAALAPGDPDLLGAAVEASLAGGGNYAAAAALAEREVSKSPKNPFALLRAAQIYLVAGDTAPAKEMLLRALALEPLFLRARLLLAEAQAAEGAVAAARIELGKIRAARDSGARAGRLSGYDEELLRLPEARYAALERSLAPRRAGRGGGR